MRARAIRIFVMGSRFNSGVFGAVGAPEGEKPLEAISGGEAAVGDQFLVWPCCGAELGWKPPPDGGSWGEGWDEFME
jgi:hypothetical protein